MQIITFKYRIKDSNARTALLRHAIAVNQVWNYCVAHQRDIQSRWSAGAKPRPWATHFDLQKLCKGVGRELGLHQQTVENICQQFTVNRDNAKTIPAFRSSYGAKRALGWIPFRKQSRQIEGNSIWYLGKRYRFFGSKMRSLPDSAKGGMFFEDALGRWYVCFHVEVEERRPHGDGIIGIDLGLKSLATLSNGTKIDGPRHHRALETELASAQRARNKQRTLRIYTKIKNSRKDFLHKLSTFLADQNAIIAVGDVNSKQLVKTRMAKSVLDASWCAFRSMLKYKSAGYVEVDEKFTTQTCSCCGALPNGRPRGIAGLGIRRWDCSECGASHDRDVNAARNILAAALSAQRPAGGSRKIVTRGRQPDKHDRGEPASGAGA